MLNADEAVKHTPVFEQACETLRDLCDRVSSNLIDLRDMIPRSGAEPEIMPPLD